jgi:hypothetical protein
VKTGVLVAPCLKPASPGGAEDDDPINDADSDNSADLDWSD